MNDSGFSPFPGSFQPFAPFSTPTTRGTAVLRGSHVRDPGSYDVVEPEVLTRSGAPMDWAQVAVAMEAAGEMLEKESSAMDTLDDFDDELL